MMPAVTWPLVASRQKEWRYLILFAFFLGGAGAGLFFLSYFMDYELGILLSLLIVAVGKGGCHMAYLGKPMRAWRAIMRPHSSWLSRGLIGVVVFLVFGGLYLVLPGMRDTGAGKAVAVVSLLAALWVMIYTGFLMARSRAIPFWNTALLPVIFTLYGFISGMDVILVSLLWAGEGAIGVPLERLEVIEALLLLGGLVCLGVYVIAMYTASPGARLATLLWLRGDLALPFLGGVVAVGLILPLAVIGYSVLIGESLLALAALVGFLALLGGILFRWCVLRAGVYNPLL